ncbi:DUF6588 family protein [Wenyingzhuangia sp. IMCC45533]
MKKTKLTILSMFIGAVSFAQDIDVATVLESGTSDTQRLLRGYLEPAAVGFGYGMSSGWNTTAKPHKLLGFDLSVNASLSQVPSSGESFSFNNNDYNRIKLDAVSNNGATSADLPSIFGATELSERPTLEFLDEDGNRVTTLSALPGLGLDDELGINAVPAASLQLGVGLIKNTELKLRYIPSVEEDEYEFSSYGVGVLHSIKQWIPGIKALPFQLSGFVGYNEVKSKYLFNFDENPSQAFELETSSWTYQVLASKKLLFLTVYGGIGYTSYETDINVLGNFELTDGSILTDPVKLNYSGGSTRGNVGLTLKLLVLKINVDYTLQEYNTLSATVGFTIR